MEHLYAKPSKAESDLLASAAYVHNLGPCTYRAVTTAEQLQKLGAEMGYVQLLSMKILSSKT